MGDCFLVDLLLICRAYRKYCATIISEGDSEITVQQKEKLEQFRWEKGITNVEHFQVMEEMKWSKAGIYLYLDFGFYSIVIFF
jgi:hypothetical protein